MGPECSPKTRRTHGRTMQQIRGVCVCGTRFRKTSIFWAEPTLQHLRSYTKLGTLGDVPWPPAGLFDADMWSSECTNRPNKISNNAHGANTRKHNVTRNTCTYYIIMHLFDACVHYDLEMVDVSHHNAHLHQTKQYEECSRGSHQN